MLTQLLRSIRSTGQAQVKLHTHELYSMEAQQRPDNQFRFRSLPACIAHLPWQYRSSATLHFLVEIGNSQKAKVLQGLAP